MSKQLTLIQKQAAIQLMEIQNSYYQERQSSRGR